jgi:hypothetical protein
MMNEPAILANFDPNAIADEVAALETEAQSKLADAKGEFASRSEQIAAILWNVKQHHPEHLDAICERAKIGLSRRKELLQIGSGRKTIKQSRQANAARQARFKAKKKANAAEPPTSEAVTKASVTASKAGSNPHPARNAADMAHAADEAKDESASKPKSAPKTMSEPESATALAEFKVACDHWLPLLNERDQDKASTHVNSMFEKLKNSRSSPEEAA